MYIQFWMHLLGIIIREVHLFSINLYFFQIKKMQVYSVSIILIELHYLQ